MEGIKSHKAFKDGVGSLSALDLFQKIDPMEFYVKFEELKQ